MLDCIEHLQKTLSFVNKIEKSELKSNQSFWKIKYVIVMNVQNTDYKGGPYNIDRTLHHIIYVGTQ